MLPVIFFAAGLFGRSHALQAGAPPATNEAEQLLRVGPRWGSSISHSSHAMLIAGHTVSEVSSRWGDSVVYAVFTSSIPKYHDQLLAELDTWAARPASEGRFVAVGGENYPEEWLREGTILNSTCGDAMRSIACKEASLLLEAAARGAAWVVVVGEDNYVNVPAVEAALRARDPDDAVALGVVGCGKGMYCSRNSDFREFGGFCGGCGYIISRAALQTLVKGGAAKTHEMYDVSSPNDMATSCNLREHDVRMEVMDGLFGFPISTKGELDGMISGHFLTVHYILPHTMRYMHAKLEGNPPERVSELESRAFDSRGCAELPAFVRRPAPCR